MLSLLKKKKPSEYHTIHVFADIDQNELHSKQSKHRNVLLVFKLLKY